MLHYSLQVIAFQLLFLIIYDVFLSKETFFNLNRAYLLSTAMLSVVIPFIKIEQIKAVVANDFIIRLPEVIIGNSAESISIIDPQIALQAGLVIEPKPTPVWVIILVSGMCFATLVLVLKVLKLVRLVHKNPKRWHGHLRIITLLNSTKAFSFFHYIFLGEKLSAQEKSTILKHELVHVKQKHTIDLLFFEVFRVVFWFNPLVYMYQNRIAIIHEYLADAKAVKTQNKTEYYDNLLAQVFETQQFSFVNPFFKESFIKKRIIMLSKSKSKQIHILKYALLIPMVFTMLIYTSSYAQDKDASLIEANEISNLQELTDQELFDKYYQEIVDLYKNETEFYNIYRSYVGNTDTYIMSRDDYYKQSAFFKFMFSKRKSQPELVGEIVNENQKSDYQKFTEFKPYATYLAYKKTDDAKEIWENNTKDGVLRLVVGDFGNWTEKEEQKMKHKLEMIERDDYFKELLVVPMNGKSKMLLKDPKSVSKISEDLIVEEVVESVEVPFAVVSDVPIYKGCEDLTTNDERKKCTSERIAMQVNKYFNTNLADSLGLIGRQRINVMFKIDKEGYVFGVKARAPHPALEAEAIRVIQTLPQFIPGKHKNETVVVPYSLPIIFQVNANQKEKPSTPVWDTIIEPPSHTIPFSEVDKVPCYQSCIDLATEKERKTCVSKEISIYVNRNFNTNMASKLNLNGRQQLAVVFDIDTQGYVKNVKARASHPDLEKEAIRVIKSLPKFETPGLKGGKPVKVSYSLPIIFQVQ